MNKSVLIFASGFLGEEVLERLSKSKSRPFVAIYPQGARRRRETDNLSAFSNIFQTFVVNSDKFSNIDSSSLPVCDYAVTVDWTKDFFHGAQTPYQIYHCHTSLLPMYRGYGAVSEQFLRGVCLSGLSVYEENGVIDGGDLAVREQIRITHDDTPDIFLKKCAEIIANFIKHLEDGEIFESVPQDLTKSFYVARTRNNQKTIDFNASAYSVYNFIRAYSYPYPSARFYYNDEQYEATVAYIESWSGIEGAPGEIINLQADGLEAACGEGSIRIKKIRLNGLKVDIEKVGFEEGTLLK